MFQLTAMTRMRIGFPSTYILVYANIEDIGSIAGFWFENIDPVVGEKLADRTLFIIAIAEDARTDWTDFNTGRQQSLGDAVIAPGAFVGNLLFRIEEPCAVRTGLNTVLATDAIGMVNQDRAVFRLECRAGWAHLHASRMSAVIAQLGNKKSLVDLRVLVAVGKSIVPLCTSGCYIHRVGLAVDMRSVVPVKIDIAFDPGAKMMRV